MNSGLIGNIYLINTDNIGEKAFRSSNISSVTLGQKLEEIKSEVFCECKNLETINLNAVSVIHEKAFLNCEKLKDIKLNSCVCIMKEAFMNCKNISCAFLNDDITTIEERAFSNCKLLSIINIPKKIKHLGSYVFEKTSLHKQKLYFPDTLETVGEFIFNKSKSPVVYVDKKKAKNWINWNKGCLGHGIFNIIHSVKIKNNRSK